MKPRLEVSADHRQAYLNGFSLELSPKEYDLLEVCARSGDHLVSYRTINQAVWGEDNATSDGKIRVLVARLRHRLGSELAQYLCTVTGHGLRLETDRIELMYHVALKPPAPRRPRKPPPATLPVRCTECGHDMEVVVSPGRRSIRIVRR